VSVNESTFSFPSLLEQTLVAERAGDCLEQRLNYGKPLGRSHAQELREAECTRTHGVPNYPAPVPGGRYDYTGSLNPNSPAFQRASNESRSPSNAARWCRTAIRSAIRTCLRSA
jgi:hypothetical protein